MSLDCSVTGPIGRSTWSLDCSVTGPMGPGVSPAGTCVAELPSVLESSFVGIFLSLKGSFWALVGAAWLSPPSRCHVGQALQSCLRHNGRAQPTRHLMGQAQQKSQTAATPRCDSKGARPKWRRCDTEKGPRHRDGGLGIRRSGGYEGLGATWRRRPGRP